MFQRFCAILALITILGVTAGYGQAPQMITYQGLLTDDAGSPVADGIHALTFRVFDAATSGTALWSETQSSVSTSGGLFKAFLGIVNPIALAFDVPYWLEVQVGGNSPQSPRVTLTTVPYSYMAMEADRVDGYHAGATPTANTLLALDGTGQFPSSAIPSVPSSGPAGGDLTGTYPNPSIAADVVTSEKIQNGQVQTVDIADQAVTQAKIAPDVMLPPGGAAGGDLTGTYPDPTIANNAVTSAKIQDGQVHTSDVADFAITQDKLHPTVTLPAGGPAGGDLEGDYPNPTITANAITSGKIQDGEVQTTDIADDAITTAKIAPDLVSSIDGVYNDGGNIDFVAGANITIMPDDGANTITIDAAGGGGGDITSVWPADATLTGGASQGDATLAVANPLELMGSTEGVVRGTNASGDYGYLGGDGRGVVGYSNNVYAGPTSTGVWGRSDYPGGLGVYGTGDTGVFAHSNTSSCSGYLGGADAGAHGQSSPGGCSGALGTTWGGGGVGVSGFMANPSTDWAGYFDGDARVLGYLVVDGDLSVSGNKNFLIDHPLDPENKLLRHSCVESPENLVIYRGKASLNAGGEAIVEMPGYFEALTKEDDASIHLTPVGRPFLTGAEWSPGFQRFTVYGEPERHVYWEVLANRDDPSIRLARLPVEIEKTPDSKLCARGKLLSPTAYGYPESMGHGYEDRQETIRRHREMAEQIHLDGRTSGETSRSAPRKP